MTTNPQECCPDDTICFLCHAPLPDDPEPGTPEFDGFCGSECKEIYEQWLAMGKQQRTEHLHMLQRELEERSIEKQMKWAR